MIFFYRHGNQNKQKMTEKWILLIIFQFSSMNLEKKVIYESSKPIGAALHNPGVQNFTIIFFLR